MKRFVIFTQLFIIIVNTAFAQNHDSFQKSFDLCNKLQMSYGPFTRDKCLWFIEEDSLRGIVCWKTQIGWSRWEIDANKEFDYDKPIRVLNMPESEQMNEIYLRYHQALSSHENVYKKITTYHNQLNAKHAKNYCVFIYGEITFKNFGKRDTGQYKTRLFHGAPFWLRSDLGYGKNLDESFKLVEAFTRKEK